MHIRLIRGGWIFSQGAVTQIPVQGGQPGSRKEKQNHKSDSEIQINKSVTRQVQMQPTKWSDLLFFLFVLDWLIPLTGGKKGDPENLTGKMEKALIIAGTLTLVP